MFSAWREFRRGKRGRRDVAEFECSLEDNIFALREDLASGRYKHGPYQRFHIFDPKHRIIHKASVRDRLVHHAVYRVLYPIFEQSFIYDSYSCRIGKGTHAAVSRLQTFVRKVSKNYTSPCWALKFDIKKFFDSVDHNILLNVLKQKISCPKTNRLLAEIVNSYLSSNSVGGGAILRTIRAKGLPIGNLTSQLFANVYLNAFDHFIKETVRTKYCLRYTDDALIIHQDPQYLKLLIPFIQHWLWQERRLCLHPNKTSVRKLSQGIDFLGYVTMPHYRVLRTKTKRRMLNIICEDNLVSYAGLLKHCSGHELIKTIYGIIS